MDYAIFFKNMIFEPISTNGLCRFKDNWNSRSHSALKLVKINIGGYALNGNNFMLDDLMISCLTKSHDD
jgi:hypothetical protein